MGVRLSGGDHGGELVTWEDDGTGHMRVGDLLYRLNEDQVSACFVGIAP